MHKRQSSHRLLVVLTALCLAGCLVLATSATAETVHKIGVLAKNGPVKAMTKWQATGDYLTAKLAGKKFEIVPLDFFPQTHHVETLAMLRCG